MSARPQINLLEVVGAESTGIRTLPQISRVLESEQRTVAGAESVAGVDLPAVYDAAKDLRYWKARSDIIQDRRPAVGSAAELVRAHGVNILRGLALTDGAAHAKHSDGAKSSIAKFIPSKMLDKMLVESAGSPWLAWRGRAFAVEKGDNSGPAQQSGETIGLLQPLNQPLPQPEWVNLDHLKVADLAAARRAIADRIFESLTGVVVAERGEWLASPQTRDLARRVRLAGSSAATDGPSSDTSQGGHTFRVNFYLPDSYIVTDAALTAPAGEPVPDSEVDRSLFGGFIQERQAALMHLEFEHFDVPHEIQAMTRAALEEVRCFGLNDPMYLANYAAVRMGVGTGRGEFDHARLATIEGQALAEHVYRHAEHFRATYLGPLGLTEERAAVDRIYAVMSSAIDMIRRPHLWVDTAANQESAQESVDQPMHDIERPRGA